MFGEASLGGLLILPAALINAADIVAHQQQVGILQAFAGNAAGAGELRPGMNRNEFAEQVESPAEVVHITAAARSVENGASGGKNLTTKSDRRFWQWLAELRFRLFPDRAPVPHVESQPGRFFQRAEHAQSRADDFRPDAVSLEHSDHRPHRKIAGALALAFVWEKGDQPSFGSGGTVGWVSHSAHAVIAGKNCVQQPQ